MPSEHPLPAGLTTAIRVLLIDDEEMSRRGFSAALEEARDITVVGHARVGTDALALVLARRPHVVLLNLVTNCHWVATIQNVLAALPQPDTPRVIVVTGADTEDCLLPAVRAGVAGVLLRSLSVNELMYAVRQVAMGHSVLSPGATACLFTRLRPLADLKGRNITSLEVLSQREREVLAGLASGKSNQEIAAEIHLTVATVKSHVSNILTKLEVRDRLQAALLGQLASIWPDEVPARY